MGQHPPLAGQNALGIKSILGTEFLTKSQISSILETAFYFKEFGKTKAPVPNTLHGKTVILMFFEPSTRTRGSFELAAKRLGGVTVAMSREGSSIEKGETLFDMAKNIEAMQPDALVLRHSSAGTPNNLDKILNIPIINAGDGFHEHPTQALLDLMTILEFRKQIEGLKVLIVGDIAHSRVARSNIYALKTMGAEVTVCGPPTLLPPKVEKMGVHVEFDLEKAVKGQDIVMLLRVQIERLGMGQTPSRGEYSRFYGMSRKLLEKCKEDVLIMHPGPVNRGVELSTDVADGARSAILSQVTNGVLIRMAVLHLLTGGEVMRHSPGGSKRG